MNIAIIRATGEQVEILSVNGGWSTVRPVDGFIVSKVRNGALEKVTIIDEEETPITAKAIAEREPRAKKPINERLNGVVYPGYLPQYVPYTVALKDGTKRRSLDKGDSVALYLRGMNLSAAYKAVASEANTSPKDLAARFEHLNPGMQRMNLGNILRRARREAAKGAAQ